MAKWTKPERKFLDIERERLRTDLEAMYSTDVLPRLTELERIGAAPPDPELGRKFAIQSVRLWHWLLYQGLYRVGDGDVAGWSLVHDALEYRGWQSRVFERFYERDARPDRFRLELTLYSFSEALFAQHVGHTETADVIVSRLADESRKHGSDNWRFSTGALPFQVRLYELRAGRPSGIDAARLPDLGRYAALLDAPSSGQAYRDELAWAASEHLAQTQGSKRRAAPFSAGFLRWLPIEIVAWQRFRREQSFEVSTDEHPLLEAATSTLDPPPAPREASEYRCLLDRARPHLELYLGG